MFDAYEAVDAIIDDINESYNEACYEDIYDELCYRVECGEMSLEDAEIVNEAAYDKYVTEIAKWRKVSRDAWRDNSSIPNDKYFELMRQYTHDDTGFDAFDNLSGTALADKDARHRVIPKKYYNDDLYRDDTIKAKDYIKKISNPNYSPLKDLSLKEPGKYLKLQQAKDRVTGRRR